MVGVVQRAAFERQEIVIAATPRSRILTADLWPCVVNRAVARFAIDETADRAIGLVALVAQSALALFGSLLRQLLLGLVRRHTEMLGEALKVRFGDDDMRVRAAVGGAAAAIEEVAVVFHDMGYRLCSIGVFQT